MILGNINILEASINSKVKRFVYASSIYVYSQKGGFYRCSKQASEIYIEEYNRYYGLKYTILRYGSLYGPRADKWDPIYRYLNQAIKENNIKCNNPEEVREYINVKDAAKLSIDILDEKFSNRHIILSGHYRIKTIQRILKISNNLTFKSFHLSRVDVMITLKNGLINIRFYT